jgi:long-chain acyl-CoA synthetase
MKQHIVNILKERASKYGSSEMYRFRSGQKYHSISWNEILAEVENVSCALSDRGYGYGSKIGIFSNNRPEWSITDYGILGIRGVVVPFFGTATREQVRYIVDETGMELMFAGNAEQVEKAVWVLDHSESLKNIVVYDPTLQLSDPRCISWTDFIVSGSHKRNPEKLAQILDEAQPDDLATIIYTSGTTGEPKGVMIGHDNFIYCFGIHDQRIDVTDKDVSMCFLPLSHIFERTWSYYIMHCGAVNVFLENPREVIDVLPVVKPTLICTVPRFFEKTHEGIMTEYSKWSGAKKIIFDWAISKGRQSSQFRRFSMPFPFIHKVKHAIADRLVLRKLRGIFGGNIRMMPCSGAAIRPELLNFFHAAGLFVNFGYGATETTATVSCFKSDVYELESCGTQMPGIEVRISDKGEILVKGKTVFRGYFKKKSETDKVLVDGWYHTGDKGHFSDSGNLVMTDRINDLFKTSVGKYVSPQKIELTLGRDAFIEQVIAIGDNRKYITALIVPSLQHLKDYAQRLELKYHSDAHLVSLKEIRELIAGRIEVLQSELASFEKVVRFTLLHEPFTIENNAMTSTLKFRRKVISEKYRDEIEEMYSK